MKYLLDLPEGELYASGDRRYRLKIWDIIWSNHTGTTFHGVGYVFTINGWTEVTRVEIEFKYEPLPRSYSDAEKQQLEMAKKEFKSILLSYLMAFHDG